MWELASGSGALGAGLAAATALTVTLYLLKVRRRRQPVVFLALWQKVLQESQRTAWWRNLRRLFSLLLQLLLLVLLFAAVANPRRKLDETDRSVVIVVDRSASMATADLDGKQTRYAAAQKQALQLLGRLGPRDRATVIVADHHPRALGPIGSDVAELRRQLASIDVGQTPLDVEATLRLASDLLLGQSQPTIALFTDGAFAFPPNVAWQTAAPKDSPSTIDLHGVALSAELVGKQRGNVGITAFAARRYRANLTAYEVLLELGSSFEEDKSVEIELSLDGQTVALETITIEKGSRAQKLFSNLSGGGARLEAKIRTAVDAFPLDDRAYAVLPQPRPLRVLLVSTGNLFVEGALLLDKSLAVEKVAPNAYREDDTKRFDAVVFDRFLPTTGMPATAALILGPPAGAAASPFGGTRVVNGPIVTELDRKHPLMKWIDLKDLNIGASVSLEAKPGDAVLARALRDPLIVAGARGKQRYVEVGFDVQKSDWPLRVSFPVFMTNVLSWFTETSEAPDLSLRVGVSRRLQLAETAAGATVRLVAPDGTWRELPVTEGGRVQVTIESSGFHELRLGPGRVLTIPASLLSPAETLTPFATKLTLEDKPLGGPLEGQDGLPIDLWPICVVLALLIAAIEWWTYHRRVTV